MKLSISILLAAFFTGVYAETTTYVCVGNAVSRPCILGGIENANCYGIASTRKCNIAGKNCDYCDIKVPYTDPRYDNLVGSLKTWCNSHQGMLSNSGFAAYPECR